MQEGSPPQNEDCGVGSPPVAERETPSALASAPIWQTHSVALFDSAMRLLRWNLNGQMFAAFGAASSENGAARCRAHPGEKSVRAFASQVAWLISSFHWCPSVRVTYTYDICRRSYLTIARWGCQFSLVRKFGLHLAGQEVHDHLTWRFAGVQQGVHLLDNGHFH